MDQIVTFAQTEVGAIMLVSFTMMIIVDVVVGRLLFGKKLHPYRKGAETTDAAILTYEKAMENGSKGHSITYQYRDTLGRQRDGKYESYQRPAMREGDTILPVVYAVESPEHSMPKSQKVTLTLSYYNVTFIAPLMLVGLYIFMALYT